ncbi:MAG: hypothetical protein R3Y67_10005 [Eubacteriales bacterium]
MEETAEAKIVIDTSVLDQRITTYSSLTDQNEIALFTDTYNQLEEKRRLNEENGAYRDAIFLVDIQVDGVEEVKNALFTTIGEEKYQEIVEGSVSLDYVWYVAVLGSMIIGLLLGFAYLRICSKKEETCQERFNQIHLE